MDTRLIESEDFKYFRKSMPSFPEGEIWHEDAPDFIIHANTGLIGVEHRRLFKPSDFNKSPMQARESQVDDILEIAKEHAELRGLPPVSVNFIFSKKEIRLNKAGRLELGRKITRIVAENLPSENDFLAIVNSEVSRLGFPDEIDAVFISRYGSNQHKWYKTEAASVITDCIDVLQQAISDKAKKLLAYKNNKEIREFWLLIVADALNSSGRFEPDEASKNYLYNSPFDRTYFQIYAAPPPNLIELKTTR